MSMCMGVRACFISRFYSSISMALEFNPMPNWWQWWWCWRHHWNSGGLTWGATKVSVKILSFATKFKTPKPMETHTYNKGFIWVHTYIYIYMYVRMDVNMNLASRHVSPQQMPANCQIISMFFFGGRRSEIKTEKGGWYPQTQTHTC